MFIRTQVDIEDISFSREEAETLIMDIDKSQEDWEFTERMTLYFVNKMKKFYKSDEDKIVFINFIEHINKASNKQ